MDPPIWMMLNVAHRIPSIYFSFPFFFHFFNKTMYLYNCYALQLFVNFVLHCIFDIVFSTWKSDRAKWIRCQSLLYGLLLCKSCTLANAYTKKKKKERENLCITARYHVWCLEHFLAIDNANSIFRHWLERTKIIIICKNINETTFNQNKTNDRHTQKITSDAFLYFSLKSERSKTKRKIQHRKREKNQKWWWWMEKPLTLT